MDVEKQLEGQGLIGLKTVAEMTGKTRQGLHYMIKNGTFPAPVKIMGRIMWDRSWVEHYLTTGENVRPLDEAEKQVPPTPMPPKNIAGSWTGDKDMIIVLLREYLNAADDTDAQLLGKTIRFLEAATRIKNILCGYDKNNMQDE